MPNLIPRDFIDRLVSDSDIVSVLGAYLDLNKKGNNYVCRCPFHEEKTGSFTVSPQKSIYHCFGCGRGGNVLTFIQEYEGLSFVEAVEKLAEINNVTVPRESKSNVEDYLKQRGLSGSTAKKFLIGYADFDQKELKKKLIDQFSEATLLKSGNFLKNDKGMYPFFRNRLMFPKILLERSLVLVVEPLMTLCLSILIQKIVSFLTSLESFMVLILQNKVINMIFS